MNNETTSFWGSQSGLVSRVGKDAPAHGRGVPTIRAYSVVMYLSMIS